MSDQVNARPTARVTKAAKTVTNQVVDSASSWRLPDLGALKLSSVHLPEIKFPEIKLPQVKVPNMSDLSDFAGKTTEQVKAKTTSVRGGVAHTVTLVREAVGV